MARHVHVHLHRRDERQQDEGTPESAQRAAQTRRLGGSSGMVHPPRPPRALKLRPPRPGYDGSFGRTWRGGTDEEIEGETREQRPLRDRNRRRR